MTGRAERVRKPISNPPACLEMGTYGRAFHIGMNEPTSILFCHVCCFFFFLGGVTQRGDDTSGLPVHYDM